jgi:hypothetical protein
MPVSFLCWATAASFQILHNSAFVHRATNKATIWGLRPEFYYCQTVAGLLMWGALSDERTDLPFIIAAGPRQRSDSQARVPWDSEHILLSQIREFPFRRLLRLAGLQWKYSTPLPPQSVPYRKNMTCLLFRETVAVCCENHTEHTDTLCGHNAELILNLKAGDTYSYHCTTELLILKPYSCATKRNQNCIGGDWGENLTNDVKRLDDLRVPFRNKRR